METVVNFKKGFDVTLVSGNKSFTGTTISQALANAGEVVTLEDINLYLGKIYHKFDTETEIPFDFYGVKIAEHMHIQVFLTKAGNIIIVSSIVDNYERDTVAYNGGTEYTITAIERKYIFNRIQLHTVHDLNKELLRYIPRTEIYVSICKQLDIDYVEHLE